MRSHHLSALPMTLLCLVLLTTCTTVRPDASLRPPPAAPIRVTEEVTAPAVPIQKVTEEVTAPAVPIQVIHTIQAPFEWYVWQGYRNEGRLEANAKTNCGLATVAMALRYSSNNLIQVSPEGVRDMIPHLAGTDAKTFMRDRTAVFDTWGIPYRALHTLPEIEAAIANDHIVLVSINMAAIRPAPGTSDEASGSVLAEITGRYNDYDQQHAIVLKGIVQDTHTGQRYFVVYDPNVWEGNPKYYYHGNARLPKGLDRLYAYEDIATAMQAPFFFEAVEVLATPQAPITPAAPIVSKALEVGSAWCAAVPGDVAGVRWCA